MFFFLIYEVVKNWLFTCCLLYFPNFLFFQNELLGKPTRKLLKDDAVPTLFEHNAGKQNQKQKASVKREEQATKKQLCEGAIAHHSNWEEHEKEMNTKEVQTIETILCTTLSQNKHNPDNKQRNTN